MFYSHSPLSCRMNERVGEALPAPYTGLLWQLRRERRAPGIVETVILNRRPLGQTE